MRILAAIFTAIGLLGWALAFSTPPAEEQIILTVTSQSAQQARETCQQWKKNNGGVVGHVLVRDVVDETYNLPCGVLIR